MMKVVLVQLLLSLLHLAGGEHEGAGRGEGNGWGEALPVLIIRNMDQECLGIKFPFMKVLIKY